MGVVGLFAVGGVGITGDDEADIAEQARYLRMRDEKPHWRVISKSS